MNLEQYVESTHVVFGSPFSSTSPMEEIIDQALKARNLERTRSVQVSSMLLVPYVVAASPHVAALPAWFTHQYALSLPLQVRSMPLDVQPIVIRMLWHDRTHRTGMHRWVGQRVRELTAQLAQSRSTITVSRKTDGERLDGAAQV